VTESLSVERTLKLAEDVVGVVRAHQLDAVVIGAMALAVHGYPRDTSDLDLAISADPKLLHTLAQSLRLLGHEVEVRDPDPQDPLGGVLDVRAAGADLVQVVNFLNPPAGGFPRLVADALIDASPLVPGSTLRVVSPYHLVAFKLYAGGAKSKLDILELLDRNPQIDRARLQALCDEYRLRPELDEVLALEDR
jgi:hypothetical protein